MLKICIRADMISGNLPLLLSGAPLRAWKCRLCFQTSTLQLENELTAQLQLAGSGHLMMPFGLIKRVDRDTFDEILTLREAKSEHLTKEGGMYHRIP